MRDGAVIEKVDPERARSILKAPNARAMPPNRQKLIVAIELLDYGGDWRHKSAWNNPQKLVFNAETDENPPKVWAFKKINPVHHRLHHGAGSADPYGDKCR